MNNRINNNPFCAIKTTPQRPLKTDYRLLVLLAFGLLIICIHLSGLISPSERYSFADGQDKSIVWLAGDDISNGLYWISSHPLSQQNDNWQSIYASFDLNSPSDAHDVNTIIVSHQNQQNISGFRLDNGSSPIAISPPAKIYPFFFEPLPINEADSELLTTIPGIGSKLAEKIITLRQEKNKFSSPDELLEVSGIGHNKLEKLLQYLAFN